MEKKIKLVSYWNRDAVNTLLTTGTLTANAGKRLFKEGLDKRERNCMKKAYAFIAKNTPLVPKGSYPMWAWMCPSYWAEREQEDMIKVCYTKSRNEVLCTNMNLYSSFFGFGGPLFTDDEYEKYGDEVIEAIANSLSRKEIEETWKKCFVHDWRKRTTTQVTFYELRLEEVTNLEEIKSQLKKLG